jgi:2-polyprenyl-6-methoxyphenol hydroxylase-like FAD-dependent oxidoreductase
MNDPWACDVIVAGAGPVGLAAALLLAMAGVRVTLLEKRASLTAASRASTLHPPTLEILDHLGALAPVHHEGIVADRIQYRTLAGVFAAFDLRDLAEDTAFPYRLHLEQARITPVMLDRLRSHANATVMFDTEVTDVSQDAGRVTLTTKANGTKATLTARYVLAADGAHSQIRTALGIAFDGIVYPDKILRIMTQDDLQVLLPDLAPTAYLFHDGRSISFLKMPECWRIILRVPQAVSDEAAMEPSWMLDRLQAVLPECRALPTVMGKDVYGASRRVASRFCQGRVALIGDCAHVTNTRGGMNMNCGIHDAAALAAAIIAALPRDDGALIAAAAAARHRVATEMLIPRTDRNVSGGPAWTDSLRHTAADKVARRAYLRTAAMLDMLDRNPPHD